MTDDRTVLDKLLAAGAAADGFTPGYAIVRNALLDGSAVNVHSAVWHQIAFQAASRRHCVLERTALV